MRMKQASISKRLCRTLLRTLWLSTGLLLSNTASAITVTASPTTCASVVGIGTQAWSNPTRAISSNNSYATASVDGTTTRFLRCTGYSFAIPAGATINGITVSVERKSNRITNGGSRDAAMRVVKAGLIGSTDRSTATIYTTADVTEAHGGATDLWGETWTAADINAASFGAAFAATKASAAGSAHTVSVDHVRITVDYSIPPGTYSLTASPTTCTSVAGIGTRSWSNPSRAVSSNNSSATASVDGTTTRFLRCTGYNFAIPAGAIINGITVNVERSSNRTSNGGSKDAAMRLVKAGVIGTADRSTATIYTTTDVIEAHGGAADLWGMTWSPVEINAANFGAAFAATKASGAGPAHIVSVDHMPITVTFTITGLDHYELSLQTSSITCLPSTATVTACADNSSPCTNRHLAAGGSTATLSTSAGTLANTTVTFGATGVASTTLSYPLAAEGATASVTLSGEQTAATNPRKCCPDGINCAVANSCSTIFNTAGFIFSTSANGSGNIATQIAGKLSNTYYLRAIKTISNPAIMACESALAGPQSVNFAYECNDPTTCYTANLMSVNGTTIARNNNGNVASYTPVNMTFDANGNAQFTFTYLDAGKVKFYANKTVNGAPLTGTSNPFVVRPFGFAFSEIKKGTGSCNPPSGSPVCNPGASTPSGTAFAAAGNDFSATVRAVAWQAADDQDNDGIPDSGANLTDNVTTPNYAWATALSAGAPFTPDPGAQGTLNNGNIVQSTFSGGAATVANLQYSEVGSFTLQANASNYLNSGTNVSGNGGVVGRFYPDHFALLSGSAVTAACGGIAGFTYMGQPNLSESYEIEAQNSANVKTLNYTDAFVKATITNVAENNDNGTNLSARLSVPGGAWSQGKYTVSTNLAKFSRPVTALPDASWGTFDNLQIGVSLVDPDGPMLLDLNMNPATAGACGAACTGKRIGDDETVVPSTPRTTRMRFGRLRMNNAYGSELLPLPVPLLAQYWNGTGFILNADDSCTQVPVPTNGAGLTFYAQTSVNQLAGGETLASLNGAVAGNGTFASGDGGLRLSTPGLNNYGYVDVQITAPDYLQYNWNGAATAGNFFDDNPSARATFGKYKQRNELIYMREIH